MSRAREETSQYASFLIRCWLRRNGERHVQLEHIQSGAQVRLTDLGQALAWLTEQWQLADGQRQSPEVDERGD